VIATTNQTTDGPSARGTRRAVAGPVVEQPRSIARRTTVVVLVTLLLVSLAYICWQGVHVLLEAFAGILFAIFLTALAEKLRRRSRLSYGLALAVVLVMLFLAVALTAALLASRLATQIGELSHKLPQALQAVRDYLEEYSWGRLLLDHMPGSAAGFSREMSSFTRVTGLISGVANFLLGALVVLFVGIFGAAEPELYRAGLLHLVPSALRPRAAEAVDAVVYNLRWWLLGQVFLMLTIGVTTAFGLWLIGVPLALSLGVIAGIMEMVPYIGPWISGVPATLIALLVGPQTLFLTIGLYLFLHILEGYVLLPLVQRRAVLLSPALTLVMQVLLGDLLGIMGLFVAAPLTVVVVVLLKMLYVEDTLGDQAVDVPGEPGNREKLAAANAEHKESNPQRGSASHAIH
jgi:predicted PurR-regulated permease PerM